MNEIVRVWGTCDKLKIEFNYEGGKQWSCTVPPDFKDGIYVAEFWAQDIKGRLGHWSGFLYMTNGVCHFKFKEEKYQFWIYTNKYEVEFKKEDLSNYIIDFLPFYYFSEFDCDRFDNLFYKNIYDFETYFDSNCEIDFIEDNYEVEILKSETKVNKQIDLSFKNNFQAYWDARALTKNLSEAIAILGKAILGKAILGYRGDPTDIKINNYQIIICTDDYKFEFLEPKYEIFYEKRCGHWEL